MSSDDELHHSCTDSSFIEEHNLTISPENVVVNVPTTGFRPLASFVMRNVSNFRLAFRIKSTRSHLFVLNAAVGTLEPGEQRFIHIKYNRPGQIPRMKFTFLVFTAHWEFGDYDKDRWNAQDRNDISWRRVEVTYQ